MFTTLEDLVETSINLNYKALPILQGISIAVTSNREQYGEEYTDILNNIQEVVKELEEYLIKIESSVTEEGGINLNDFEERKFH